MKNSTFFTAILLACSLHAFADEAAAKVVKVDGKVTASNEANETRPLARGADVFSKDTLTTPDAASVTLRFTDGTLVDLAAKSTYRIQDYHFDKNDPKKDAFHTEVVSGGIRSISGELATRNPAQYETKSRLTTLTVRGTYFYLMAPPCAAGTTCDAVKQFTVDGKTSLKYKDKEYLLGPGTGSLDFTLADNGSITLSDTLPSDLPVAFSSSITAFSSSASGYSSGGGGAGGSGGSQSVIINGSGSSPTTPCQR
jgi:hypothetical protein